MSILILSFFVSLQPNTLKRALAVSVAAARTKTLNSAIPAPRSASLTCTREDSTAPAKRDLSSSMGNFAPRRKALLDPYSDYRNSCLKSSPCRFDQVPRLRLSRLRGSESGKGGQLSSWGVDMPVIRCRFAIAR